MILPAQHLLQKTTPTVRNALRIINGRYQQIKHRFKITHVGIILNLCFMLYLIEKKLR